MEISLPESTYANHSICKKNIVMKTITPYTITLVSPFPRPVHTLNITHLHNSLVLLLIRKYNVRANINVYARCVAAVKAD